MNLFKLKQYIKYRLKAQGRHGLHSPFAYAFVEDVLRNIRSKEDLLFCIAEYYSIKKFFQYEDGGLVNKSVSRDKKILKKSSFTFERVVVYTAEELENAIANLPTMKVDDIVLVYGLHDSAANEVLWQRLHSDPRVTLSMDVFAAGLLFSREEFKVKQHFVLR